MEMTEEFEASLQVLRGFDTDITTEVNEIKGGIEDFSLLIKTCDFREALKMARNQDMELSGNYEKKQEYPKSASSILSLNIPHSLFLTFLIGISCDGFVSLLTDSGNTKDDLKLPTDDTLLNQGRHQRGRVLLHRVLFD
ncbi:hypothetical protein ACFE04_024060 [Oxalis oulophora]